MIETKLGIDGMACSMCEAHINDTIRRQFQVKKVTSSHKKGKTEIITEEPLEEEALKKAIADTGYELVSMQTEPYVKKGLFHR